MIPKKHHKLYLRTLPGYLFSGLLQTVLTTVLAYWMTPLGFGAFTVAYHALRLTALAGSFGFSQAGIRLLPRLLKRDDTAELRGFIRFGLLVNVAAPTTIIWALLNFTPWVTSHPAGRNYEALLWLAGALGVNLFFGGVLRGIGHPLAANQTTGAIREGMLFLFLFLLYNQQGKVLEKYALVGLLTALLCMICVQVAVLWKDRRLLWGPAKYEIKSWLRESLPNQWLALLRLLLSTADILLVGFFLGQAAAGAYHLAMTWASWAMVPFTSASAIYARTLVIVNAHRAERLALIAAQRSARFALAFTPIVLGIAIFAMLDLSSVHSLSLTLLFPLYFARMAGGMSLLLVSFGISRGLQRPLTMAASILTSLTIILSFLLCMYTNVQWVAVGYLISAILSLLVYWKLYMSQMNTR